MRERASILVGLLWCLALLAVVVVGVLHTARMDLTVVKNYGDRIQAHYLALAGIEQAKALIYHDYVTRRQAGKNHTGLLYDDAKDFENVSLGRGQFRVFRRGNAAEGGGIIYGISDEESRLNVNTAFAGELTNLDGLTPDIAASIVAWRSDVGQALDMGAGPDYYAGLQPPYLPRNGPFQTVRELLMVRDITRSALLGSDVNQNDLLGSGEGKGAGDESATTSDGGWASFMTANSTEKNFNASGKARVNVQSADETTLAAIPGLSTDMARAIVAYRGGKPLQSIADLMDVTATNAAAAPGRGKNRGKSSNADASGKTIIDEQLFTQIADDVSISDDADVAGMININTAGVEVLACLPGMDRVLAQSVVSYRQSNSYFDNIAGLLRVSGMSHDIFKQIAPLITARSETFRINSEGKIPSTGSRQRIQAIIHIDSHEVTTLAYREDL